MKLPFIDRIWTTRGFLELDPPRSPEEAFARLDPLLQANGTTYEIDGDTLTYSKENPGAQDKLATFTSGTLKVVEQGGRSRMFFKLKSTALLLCFLAPLLFLAFAQGTLLLNELERPTEAEKAAAEAEKEKKEKEEEAKEPPPMNFIDKALGAPAPETLEEKKQREEAEGEKEEGHSATPAYVFACLFAVLFVVGRILEPWLIKTRFRKALSGEEPVPGGEVPVAE